ncbi:hypothetical protein BS78_08G150600 [Paspalum vaginatum]|nr:hypothetical protein BS78_08G150600 [Paspalum vaginatum]
MTMETDAAAGGSGRDWSALPLDILLISMSCMEVPDVVHSGAVCTSWRSAYGAFRALRLPTPRQPPCLLYYAARTSPAATLYSPSTNATFRVPLPEDRGGGFLASAHGWLFATDAAANPYLINPLTGARAALPPITTLERVKSRSTDADGGVVYDVDFNRISAAPPATQRVTARRARDWMYRQVSISGRPGGAACVVLLLHMPHQELSFARPGDARWTSLSGGLSQLDRGLYSSTVYSDRDGLFYALRATGSVHKLDLSGPSPAARPYTWTLRSFASKCTGYLVPMPCGTLLLVTRVWGRYGEPRSGICRSGTYCGEVHKCVVTEGVQVEKMDMERRRFERLAPGDHALFLGSSSAQYLPVEFLPPSLSKRNCAYLADDVGYDTFLSPISRHDAGVWDFESGSMRKYDELWPLHPCPDSSRSPIWITPSLH